MTDKIKSAMQRRHFLKLASSAAVLAPLVSLSACSGGKEPAANSSRPVAAVEPAQEPRADAMPPSGDVPKIEESDPQAKALAYVHDASTIDAAKYPQYAAGKSCSNCMLYLGGEGSKWGRCSMFAGKSVNAQGWCTVHAAKA